MNIYDLTQNRLEQVDSQAIMIDKKSKTGFLIYRILVILFGVMAIGTMFWINATGFVLLEFLILAAALVCGIQYTECKRASEANNASVQTLHDFYYLKYGRLKKERNRNKYLLVMAQCDLRMQKFEDAANALNLTDYQKMNTILKLNYHMQWAILHKLTGNEEGFFQNHQMCQELAYSSKRKISKFTMQRLELLNYGTKEQILELLNTEEKLNQTGKIQLSLSITLVIYFGALLFFSGKGLLPDGLEYRGWFSVVGTIVFAVVCFASPLMGVIVAGKSKKANGKSVVVLYTVGAIFGTLYIIMICVLGLFHLVDSRSESRLPDGKILVTQNNFLDENTYYVCKHRSAFFREYLYDSDADGNEVSERSHSTENHSFWRRDNDDSNEADEGSGTYEEAPSADQNGAENLPSQQDLDGVYFGDAGMKTMYENIFHAEFADTTDVITYSYSAKGVLYAEVGEPTEKEVQGETVTTRIRLVYDRESENGACDEVVCYEYHYDAEGNEIDSTTILDIYAVVKATGEVIPSGRTAWADLGNDAYREATGE